MFRIPLLLAAMILLFALPARSQEATSPRMLSGSVRLSLWIASLDGFIQTPLGGQFDTTSSKRPTISELGQSGITLIGVASVGLRIRQEHELHFSYTGLERRGSATLERDLVTHGQLFPKGATIRSRVELPCYRFDYRPHWLLPTWAGIRLTPIVGATRLDFHYQLDSPTASGSADRQYNLYYPHYGAIATRQFGPHIRAEVELIGSAGLSNVSAFDADFRLLISLVNESHFRASFAIGLRGVWFHYRDDQDDEQNNIKIRAGSFSTNPFAGFHVGLQFSL